jgi:hypothetical protein
MAGRRRNRKSQQQVSATEPVRNEVNSERLPRREFFNGLTKKGGTARNSPFHKGEFLFLKGEKTNKKVIEKYYLLKNKKLYERKKMKKETICQQLGCSACCENVVIRLLPEEKKALEEAGTVLEPELEISGGWGISDGRRGYRIVGRCGNLREDGSCAVYGESSPVRPKARETLKPGSSLINGCDVYIRKGLGLPPVKKTMQELDKGK